MLVETINRGIGLKAPASAGDSSSQRLAFLEGTWRNFETRSFAYARLVNGVPRFPYCYGGNHSLTGEYYDILRAGDILTGKFRWLINPSVHGCIYLQVKSQNELEGGWWLSEDLNVDSLRQHPGIVKGLVPIRGMVKMCWVRDKPGKTPDWVTAYYDSLGKTNSG